MGGKIEEMREFSKFRSGKGGGGGGVGGGVVPFRSATRLVVRQRKEKLGEIRGWGKQMSLRERTCLCQRGNVNMRYIPESDGKGEE